MVLYRFRGRVYRQKRRWRLRRVREEAIWNAIVEPLADAFLRYKYGAPGTPGSPPASTEGAGSPGASNSTPDSPATPYILSGDTNESPALTSADTIPSAPPNPPHDTSSVASADGQQISYTVQVFCLFSLEKSATILRPPESVSPLLDLMANGYVTKSPAQPTVVVSIKTLELLYRLRQRKASFSIEAFAKLVCDYYQVSEQQWSPYL